MFVFFVLLLLPIIMQHITTDGTIVNYKKRNIKALTVFFFILTILVMFRHVSVGNDTGNYTYYFNRFINVEWNEISKVGLEIGYGFFNKIISVFSKEPQFFLAVTAVITSCLIYPTYKRLCSDASLAIVLFCSMSTFVMMFSGIRQMLAIGIGFIAYELVRKKKLFLFILVSCLAVTFHTSAFMLFFMYPLYHVKITKKWLYAVVPVIGVVFVFNRPIFSVLGAFIERFTDYNASITSTGAYTMLFLFVIFAVFSFLIPDESKLDKETVGLRNFLLFSVVLQMFAPLHTIAMRMNYYYIIFIPLLLPKIISCKSEKWSKVAVLGRHIMVVFFLVYFFINAYGGGALNVFPYHFFWENVI